jgi:hypothetical protein
VRVAPPIAPVRDKLGPMRSGARRHLVSAALSLGLVAALERPARANDDGAAAAVVVGIALAVADVTFGAYDIVFAARDSRPARGWAIAESVVTTPQALVANGIFAAYADDSSIDTAPETVAILLVPMALGSLSAHGIWSAGSDRIAPGVVFGASPLIATDVALTSVAIGRAARRRLGSRAFGIAQVVLTAPQVVLGAVQTSQDPVNRAGWISLTAWSGALLVHGIASAVAGAHGEPPPPPQPPRPPGPTPPVEEEKPPLKVPYPFSI